jgi:N-acetylmuramoyl-L-alanine amidase
MRNISKIIIHCTATQQNTQVSSIINYWKLQLGWKGYGYHRLIEANGNIVNLVDYSKNSNGAKGYNDVSIHIAYIGGINKFGGPIDNRTEKQKESMLKIISEIVTSFDINDIRGHYQLPNVNKYCPCFDALAEYKYILAKSLI